MANDWEEVQLQDVVSKLGDGLHGTPKYSEDGEYYFINGNNLEDGRIVFKDTTKRVNHEQYLKYKKILNDRTLLVSINGTIGNIAYYNEEKVVLGKSACYFNLKDNVDKGYVRYVLSGHYFQSYINAFATGTTIKNISLKSMREFSFKLPPLPEQRVIAHILSSLDDKIELNRQMNETLEAMAQALFKSWFVDFDPVIDNALAASNAIPDELLERAEQRKGIKKKDNSDIQDLFPDEFEFAEEMGWIPKGWESITLGDFAILGNGKTSPDRAIGDIPVFGSNGKIGDCDESNRDNTIIIGRVGSYCGSLQYYPSKCWITDNAMSAEMKNKYHNIYLFQLLSRDNLNDRRTGSGQPLLNQSILCSIKTIMPSVLVIDEYSRIANSFYEKIDKNSRSNESLAKIRDTLLPTLMSGELRIADVAEMVEDA